MAHKTLGKHRYPRPFQVHTPEWQGGKAGSPTHILINRGRRGGRFWLPHNELSLVIRNWLWRVGDFESRQQVWMIDHVARKHLHGRVERWQNKGAARHIALKHVCLQ